MMDMNEPASTVLPREFPQQTLLSYLGNIVARILATSTFRLAYCRLRLLRNLLGLLRCWGRDLCICRFVSL